MSMLIHCRHKKTTCKLGIDLRWRGSASCPLSVDARRWRGSLGGLVASSDASGPGPESSDIASEGRVSDLVSDVGDGGGAALRARCLGRRTKSFQMSCKGGRKEELWCVNTILFTVPHGQVKETKHSSKRGVNHQPCGLHYT